MTEIILRIGFFGAGAIVGFIIGFFVVALCSAISKINDESEAIEEMLNSDDDTSDENE